MLKEIAPQAVDIQAFAAEAGLEYHAAGTAIIGDIFVDSRLAKKGALFAAMPGAARHGASFAVQVHAQGVRHILTDPLGAEMIAAADLPDMAVLVSKTPRLTLARLAALVYPKQPETMVAVTGTNGKTSTASFVRQIWQVLGLSAVNFGTAGVEGVVEAETKHTTPEPVTLHKLLASLSEAGVTHGAMEASSHGLDQYRLDGVHLDAGGFTNLSRDHLDYHADDDAYRAAKGGLFARVLAPSGVAVINRDDAQADYFINEAQARGIRVLTTGQHKDADLRLVAQRYLDDGQEIRLQWQGVGYIRKLSLIGAFQAENVLVAAGLVLASGSHSAGDVFDALTKLKSVRGRMQLAAKRENGAAVFVDYAHTPDALETALTALRPHCLGRLIVVFGAGGDRDTGKRPLMGEVAARLADIAIVTDDNPRSEPAGDIRAAVKAGAVAAGHDIAEIGDRAEAILRAAAIAETGDLVLIAGKGHETGQIVGDHVLPFDDVEQASLAVAALEGRE